MATKDEFYDGLVGALVEGVGTLRKGKVLTVREVHLPPPPKPLSGRQIGALRRNVLRVSQRVFARLTNTAPQTIHAWEQGHIFKDKPEIARELLRR